MIWFDLIWFDLIWMSMLVWLTLPFYNFCGFRSVAVNSVYKLQFFYIYFKYMENICPQHIGHMVQCTQSGYKHIVKGGITEKRIGTGSWNLVEGMTHHICPRSKGQRTKSHISSKDAISRQWMVISTSNLAEIINMADETCDTLSRSLDQINLK